MGAPAMTNAEFREALAPKVAARILGRCPGLQADGATQLAHEIISLVQLAIVDRAVPPRPANDPAACG